MNVLQSLYNNRFLLALWIKRDLKARFAGSIMGLFWTIILPISTIVIYYVFFALVLKVKIPELPTTAGYFFYLLAGLLPWISLSEALNLSANSLISQAGLLKQTVFPIEILPAVPIFTSLIPQVFGTIIYIVLLWRFDCLKPIGLLYLPLLFIIQVIFTAGFGYLFSALCAIYRDFVQIINVGLQLWFYVTPILYPVSMVPEKFRWVLFYNPLTWLVKCYQDIFINGFLPLKDLLILLISTLFIFIVGSTIFSLLKPGLTDEL